MTEEKFEFKDGNQLLGIYGKVTFDPSDELPDDLVTIGFFRDECSMTRDLYYSKEQTKVAWNELRQTNANAKTLEDNDFNPLIIVFVAVFISCLFVAYICVINRGKICKGLKRSGGEEVQVV